jgi:hypothetical protein
VRCYRLKRDNGSASRTSFLPVLDQTSYRRPALESRAPRCGSSAGIHHRWAGGSASRYELYGHEYFAQRAGPAADKIATLAAGERPAELTDDERVAYDMAAALNRGGALPESTYQAAVQRFGKQGAAEIVFLAGCSRWLA